MHQLSSPEDWWTMVMGGGIRVTIKLLDSTAKERVRQANLQFLQHNAVHALDVTVLYAVAHKKGAIAAESSTTLKREAQKVFRGLNHAIAKSPSH